MYISRVEIDTMNLEKIKDLTHVGAYHSWVEDSFPEEKKQKIRTRKLWRIDKINDRKYLLVISENKPETEFLEKYGVKNSTSIKEYDSFLESIKSGEKMFFRIALNPVISKSCGLDKRGEIKPCLDPREQIEYLMNRSEKNGFSLKTDEFTLSERGTVVLKKTGKANIKFVKAVFEGYLTIKDPEVFRELLYKGMGKHKAYGFGMMTVIPLSK